MKRLFLFLAAAGFASAQCTVYFDPLLRKLACAPTGAPASGHYVTTTAESGLSAESNLGALTTGLLKISVSGGVATPSTAAATDFPVRALNGPGVAAKCQTGVPAAAVSLPAANYPAAACESDGIQAYVAFTASTAQTAYDRFDLPADWSGVLKIIVTAYSTSTNAPTIAVQLSCIATGATASPTFGSSQTISMTPTSGSGRTSVSTTLTTDNTYANKACVAGDLVEWKLAITAAAAADLRVLSVRFTE